MSWKNRLAWGTFAFVMFFVFTVGIGVVTKLQPANAAIFTSDVHNTMQNTKNAINTAVTAVNTATQVANQIKNLASMSPEGILAHYLGISQDLADITGVWQAYNGLMSATKTMDESWNSAFKQVDSFFSGETSSFAQRNSDSQSMLRALEQTYKDSMNTAKQVGDTSKSAQNLQDALNRVGNAVGAKEAAQAGTQVVASGVKEAIKTNQQLSTLITIESAKGQAEVQEQAKVLADNKTSTDNFTSAAATAVAAVKADKRSALKKQGYSDEIIDAYYKDFL